MRTADFLARLHGVKRTGDGWQAKCPAHDDRNPSLSVKEAGDRLLVKCHAGCSPEAIVAALGLTLRGLFFDDGQDDRDAVGALARRRGWSAAAMQALGAEVHPDYAAQVRFPMRDADGGIVGWKSRRADGGLIQGDRKSLTNRGGRNFLLYPTPLPAGEVVVAEGEADACAALSAGWPAVVATGGAEVSPAALEAMQRLLAGRACVLFPHNDADGAGERWLGKVAGRLFSAKAQVRVAVLNGGGNDLDDCLKAAPDKETALRDLVARATPWAKTDASATASADQGEPAPLRAVRVADYLATMMETPSWIIEGLASGGGLTFLFSRPGLGKSLLAFEMARCVACGERFLDQFETCGGPVVYLNLEMAPPQFQRRLQRFEHHHPVGGAPLFVCDEALYLNSPADFARFKALCENIGPALVVIDPLIRALPGLDENQASEVNAALSPAADLAREMGFALMCVHHARKDGDRRSGGLDSLAGSRDFAARADVALLVRDMGKNEDGDEEKVGMRVTCVKSRWGDNPPPFCLRVEDDAHGNPAILPAEMPNAKAEVLEVLAMQSPLQTGAIVAELEGVRNRDQVNRALAALVREGLIRQPRRGLYALAGEADKG